MKLVMRGNKQLRVPDERVEDMLRAGYCELDGETGKVIREPKQDALEALRKENKTLKAEIETLKKANRNPEK